MLAVLKRGVGGLDVRGGAADARSPSGSARATSRWIAGHAAAVHPAREARARGRADRGDRRRTASSSGRRTSCSAIASDPKGTGGEVLAALGVYTRAAARAARALAASAASPPPFIRTSSAAARAAASASSVPTLASPPTAPSVAAAASAATSAASARPGRPSAAAARSSARAILLRARAQEVAVGGGVRVRERPRLAPRARAHARRGLRDRRRARSGAASDAASSIVRAIAGPAASSQKSPTVRPCSSMSTLNAAGVAERPGIVCMSPQRATSQPAPV